MIHQAPLTILCSASHHPKIKVPNPKVEMVDQEIKEVEVVEVDAADAVDEAAEEAEVAEEATPAHKATTLPQSQAMRPINLQLYTLPLSIHLMVITSSQD